MSFSKGRQSPDNRKNKYYSGHHNIVAVVKTSIPPLKNKALKKELVLRGFDIPEQFLISMAAERKSLRKRNFG